MIIVDDHPALTPDVNDAESVRVARAFIDALPDPCYLWHEHRDGRILLGHTNRAGRNLAADPGAVSVGTPLERFFLLGTDLIDDIRRTISGDIPTRRQCEVDPPMVARHAWLSFTCVQPAPGQAVLIIADQTESRQAEARLHDWQERYHRLTGALADYIYTVRVENGRPVETIHSPACVAVTGHTSEEFTDDPYLWINMVAFEDRNRIREQARRVLAGESVPPVEHRIHRKNGAIRWVRNTSVPYFDQQGRLLSYDGLVQDITERKAAEQALREREELFRTLSEFSSDLIFWESPDNRLIYVSPACEDLTGYTADELLNTPGLFDRLIHPDDLIAWLGHRTSTDDRPFCAELRVVTRHGRNRWISHVSRRVHGPGGEFLGVRGSYRNITEQKEAEQKLRDYATRIEAANTILEAQKQQMEVQQQSLIDTNNEMVELTLKLEATNKELTLLARTDPLTRLLNRRAWEEAADHEHERAARSESAYSVLMIDIDYFKLYNDTLGHQAGDTCLRRVGDAILSICRKADFVGRYGGEEFIVLAPDTPADQAGALAERIRIGIRELALDHPASPLRRVTVSVGVAASNGHPWEKTVHRADEALYAAKRDGRDRIACEGAQIVPGTTNKAPAAPDVVAG